MGSFSSRAFPPPSPLFPGPGSHTWQCPLLPSRGRDADWTLMRELSMVSTNTGPDPTHPGGRKDSQLSLSPEPAAGSFHLALFVAWTQL